MNKITVLFVNHKFQKCGIYEFGQVIGNVLVRSKKYNFIYREADSWKEFAEIFQKERPSIIIYNYHPSTMGWIGEKNGLIINSHKIRVPQIGIIHEVTQKIADNANDVIFDYHIAADPTLLLKNPIVYKTGRLIPRFQSKLSNNHKINVGSFGFATEGKGFTKIIEKVQEEFDDAIINLNISFAKYGDESGDNARRIAEACHKILTKEGIELKISHNHLRTEEILKFLSKNDLNVFLYEYQDGRGISSATDWAISVKRPFAITKSSMFRHLFDCYPSICIENNSLKTILGNGSEHLERLCEEWSPENLIWDYERITGDILNKLRESKTPLQKRISQFFDIMKLNRFNPYISTQRWVKKGDENTFDGFIDKNYIPIGDNQNLNRILDNSAREKYKIALEFIKDVAPKINAKKIPEANIQQAFVFDTAYNLSKKQFTKILSVGAFEDTAAIALKKLGFQIEFIDPIINYDLSTFMTKPSVKKQSYDIIISTSVIEHVEDDENFIKDISSLLKIGGWGILTCDFNNNYKNGDEIPHEDYRFYTKKDLSKRLLGNIPDCKIVGTPDWDCDYYDFVYLNRYRYTFASFVFTKKSI